MTPRTVESEATGTRSDDVRATIDALARGALVAYTKLRDEGWVMEPMPNEAEVRAALADEGSGGRVTLDVDRLMAALVAVEESKLNPACLADQCDHDDDDPPHMDTSLGCSDAEAIAREYAARNEDRDGVYPGDTEGPM